MRRTRYPLPGGRWPLARISGSALIAGLTGLTVLALAGCQATSAASPAASATSRASAHAVTTTASRRLSIPGTHESATAYRISSAVGTVIVVSQLGNVTVTGGGAATRVTQQVTYSRTPPLTSRTLSGRTLTLTYHCPAQLICGVAYVVRVPSNVTVHVTTGVGSIRLSGLAGSVTAKARLGLINATGLTGASVSLRTDVGGVSAAFTAAPTTIQVLTRVGAITLRVPSAASYRVSVNARLGRTTVGVRQEPSSAHAITATTDVGAILVGTLA